MKLLRKWNPEAAPFIPNPGGPNVFRMVALCKDDVHTHYVCFFDCWTGKIYIEAARQRHAGPFCYQDCWQISDDKEWQAILVFLQTEECQVIQSVETRIEKDTQVFDETGKITFHESLKKLPLTPYGVDSNGSQLSFPSNLGISPSLL